MMRVKWMMTLVAAAAVTGCAGIRDHSGYVASEEMVQAIEPGIDTKQSVQATLGRPTFTGQFDDNQWYYVTRQTSQFAFRRPRVADSRVLAIRFDAAGNVIGVNETGEELAINITPSGDKTPTLGRERSFFEELFGGIGQVGGLGPGGPGGGGPQ